MSSEGAGESAQKPPMFDDVLHTKDSYDGSYILLQLRLIKLTHLHVYRMYCPIFINWTSPFPISGLLGGIFHFY